MRLAEVLIYSVLLIGFTKPWEWSFWIWVGAIVTTLGLFVFIWFVFKMIRRDESNFTTALMREINVYLRNVNRKPLFYDTHKIHIEEIDETAEWIKVYGRIETGDLRERTNNRTN